MRRQEFRIKLIGPRLAMALAVAGWVQKAMAETTVFRAGRFFLPIYVSQDSAPEEREAALEMARVMEAMAGTSTSICVEAATDREGIYIGQTRASARSLQPLVPASDWLAPRAGEIGPDGFRIRTVRGSVFIEGATPEASYFAVAWLLQHEAGVRWYAPGPLGELIPHRGEWSLPDLDIIIEPAYVSRELSGFDTPAGATWARHNGFRGRLEFSHAMGRVFPANLYAAHPEWFPLLWGRRYCPVSGADRDWQPNLALRAVADHASQAAIGAFSSEPSRFSFSLGMNDTVRFDQGPETRRLVEPMEFYRGMPNYSRLVFTFMNRAATAVSIAAPRRYLGCLAYFWSENPPPFPVERNVVPYMTSDRTQYYDPGFRTDDLNLMARWGASGVRAFGIWEYAFGSGFVVPREPMVALADAIREGWKSGARGYFAEIEPNPGFDAFKAWAIGRLLWDPSLRLSALENDFFAGYYGPAQAPMRRFFEACQTQWMGQSGPPYWLKYYGQEDQALLFSAGTCKSLRAILEEAGRLSSADAAASARVDMASRAFSVTEAYVAYDSERRVLAAIPDGPDALPHEKGGLSGAIGRLARAMRRLDSALEDASRVGTQAWPAIPDSLLRNDPVPRLLFEAGLRDPSEPRRIVEAACGDAPTRFPWRAMADGLADGLWQTANIAANSSFLITADEGQEPHFLFPRFGALPAKWELRAMPTENGCAALINEAGAANSGRRAIRIEGAWDTQFYQWIPAHPGNAYLATARLRGRSGPGNSAALYLTFLSGSGDVLGAWMQSLPKGETPDWRTEALCDRAPSKAEWVGVGVGSMRQTAADWMEADSVELRGAEAAHSP